MEKYGYYNVITWNKNGLCQQYPTNILTFDFSAQEFDYLLFLKFESRYPYTIPDISKLVQSLELIYDKEPAAFVVLTPRKDPPPFTASEDEFVFSFSCQFLYFKKLAGSLNKTDLLATDLLFELLDQLAKDNEETGKILIRQFPFEVNTSALPVNNCDVIIPHRGTFEYLRSVLYFLNQVQAVKIYVGIDQPMSTDFLSLKDDFPAVSFYAFTPNPVGPYVIRNRLIDQSSNDLILFQDSDDIPCIDRFERIANYMKINDCQLCGSHELRLDYYDRTVQAIRFPLDVNAALKTGPWHPLLHPTSAITRKAFYDCGKLSEERTFGNDTKFLLNSFFILDNIKNIDEFLYIRKRHSDSLTTSPGTRIGSTARRKLLHTWNYDFEQIQNGDLRLKDSSLFYEGSKLTFEVIKI